MLGIVLLGLSVSALWLLVEYVPRAQMPPSRMSITLLVAVLPALLGVSCLFRQGYGSPLLVSGLLGLLLLSFLPVLNRQPVTWLRLVYVLVPVLGVPAALGIIPGTERAPLYGPLTVNWVKGMLAVTLLLLFAAQVRGAWLYAGKRAGWRSWVLIPLLVIAVLLLGWRAGYGYDFKLSELTLAFLYGNLLFTVVAEEVLFRGLLQTGLMGWLKSYTPHYVVMAILLVSVLFGLAHLGGGWKYALLATVAGVVYGVSYHVTGKLSGAVLAHIGVNAGHFVFLQYEW